MSGNKNAFVFIVLFAMLAFVAVGCASATTYTVCPSGGDYTSIQAAIDAADTGDTIEVHSGTYYENVDVTKQLILRGVDIGSGKPVVDAGGSGSAIMLTVDGITLAGFNVTNAGSYAGIKVDSNNNIITGNNVSNNDCGINFGLFYSNNTITSNNVSNNNRYGIDFSYSSINDITGNTFVNDGLFAWDSFFNTVENNMVNGKSLVYLEDVSNYKVEDAGQVILVNCNNITVENLDLSNTSVGVVLSGTENSIITNNTISSNDMYGIDLDSSPNNIITGNNVCNNGDDGIFLDYSSNNTITSNNASNNNRGGICLRYSTNNNIRGNTVRNNDYSGIYLSGASNYDIIGNNISNNAFGILLDNFDSINNTLIYLNNFINNTSNVFSSDSNNILNSAEKLKYTYKGKTYMNYLGNYWYDYEGNDGNGDGVGDSAYTFNSDNEDNYPLMMKFENYRLTSLF